MSYHPHIVYVIQLDIVRRLECRYVHRVYFLAIAQTVHINSPIVINDDNELSSLN